MSHRPRSTRLRVAAVSLVTLAAVGLGATSTANATTPANITPARGVSSDTAEIDEDRLRERLELACSRVPLMSDRVSERLGRINGDADTRGSLAWLEGQADRARDAGRHERGSQREQRIKIREELQDVLAERLEALEDAAERCADNGLA